MKVYTVTLGISGEDFETDVPVSLGVFYTFEEAKKCAKKTIKEYSTDENADGEWIDENEYEETSSDEDYHFIIQIEEQELKRKDKKKIYKC